MTLEQARNTIAKNLIKLIGCKADRIFLAEWQENRIGWEETSLSTWYHTDFGKFAEIIEAATEGLPYYIECVNSCEGEIYSV